MPTDRVSSESEERTIPPADHELKVWPEYFTALERGTKTFEFRRDDRTPAFQVGDVLRLREWDRAYRRCASSMCRSSGCMFPQDCPRERHVGYTGLECLRRVTYVARGGVIPAGFCVMSVEPLSTPSSSISAGEATALSKEDLDAMETICDGIRDWDFEAEVRRVRGVVERLRSHLHEGKTNG